MNKFGFNILKNRQINYDDADLKMYKWLKKKEPSIMLCIECGTCTSTCSVNNFSEFNIRMLNIGIKRGQINNLKNEISKCMLCGKCRLVCPRGVNIANIIVNVRRYLNAYEKIERVKE